MPARKLSLHLILTAVMIAGVALVTATRAAAQTETVLHTFDQNGKDGSYPIAGLLRDASGNLYGTTSEGGAHGYGMVFEFSPNGSGGYTEKILHSFNFNNIDGFYPWSGVIFDASGNLYGTTSTGGAGTCGQDGCGIVFELLPQPNGTWMERILYSFKNNGVDGSGPLAGLIFDASGNLFGTTSGGGTYGQGTVFELTPRPGGGWGERVLHPFHYDGNSFFDGRIPNAGLVVDSSGNLYGTTSNGGAHDYGIVFEMVHTTGGGYGEKILHQFNPNGIDGIICYAGLVLGSSGNLYGATFNGGAYGYGAVFELKPQAGGSWSESILHSFNLNGTEGFSPQGGLIFDSAGSLFGTTISGGSGSTPNGTVYKLTPTSGGTWTETILYSFNTGGANPVDSLVVDSSGNLFGTTRFGGSGHVGVVFEVMP